MELDNPQHSKQFQNLLLPWSTRNICDGQWQRVVALKTSRDCWKQSNQKGCKWHTQRVSTKHAIALLYRRSWHVGMFVNLKYVFISNLIISHHYVQTWQTLTLVPLNGLFTFFESIYSIRTDHGNFYQLPAELYSGTQGEDTLVTGVELQDFFAS